MNGSFDLHVDLYRFSAILILKETSEECEKELLDLWSLNIPKDPYRVPIDNIDFWGRFSVLDTEHPEYGEMCALMIVTGKPEGWSQRKWKDELQVTIAHECIHMAYHILDSVGVVIEPNNHEALTYLVSFLQREVTAKLNKK